MASKYECATDEVAGTLRVHDPHDAKVTLDAWRSFDNREVFFVVKVDGVQVALLQADVRHVRNMVGR